MAACAIVVLAAALAVTLLAGDGHDAPAPGPRVPDVIARGALTVELPDGWRQLKEAPRVVDLRFSKPVAIFDPGSGVRLVAGFTTADSETLLAARFVEDVGTPLPRAQPVLMGAGLDAVHYFGLHGRGGSLLDVYVAPTSEGVLTAVCVARTISSLLDNCSKGVAGIILRRGRPLPLGRDAAFRDALRAQVVKLEAADAVARRMLAEAPTARGQVRALDELRATYDATARKLAALAPPAVEWPRHVLRALGRTSAAYEGLERSIAGGAGYRRARARVVERRAELRRLLDRVLSVPA